MKSILILGNAMKNQNLDVYLIKEGTEEYNGIIRDHKYNPNRLIKTKYQLTINKENIIYIQNGSILRNTRLISYF